MLEHRALAAPVRLTPVDGEPGRFVLENRQDVRNLSWLAARWVLDADGTGGAPGEGSARGAAQPLPDVPAGGSAVIDVPAELLATLHEQAEEGAEASLLLDLYAAQPSPRAPLGALVATVGVPLRAESRDLLSRAGTEPTGDAGAVDDGGS